MKPKSSPSRGPFFRRFLLLSIMLLALTCDLNSLPAVSTVKKSLDARQQVQAAWEQARKAGSYDFSADVLQRTIPTATILNAGRRSRQEAMHLEGQTDLRKEEMSFTLWSQGGSVLNAQDGVQVKVEGDRSYIRRGEGDWEEVGDLTGSFAPQGDYMAFLNAATDITCLGEETRAGVSFIRYRFIVDGPRFAAFVRDQLQAHLSAQGELPPGVTLEIPSVYAEMTGSGELYVGADGLPLHQLLWLRFPEQNDQRIDAEITVDFSHFGVSPAILAAKGKVFFNSPRVAHIPYYAALLGLAILFFTYRQTRIVQNALALVLIFSMVLTPLLQSSQVAAFSERQAEQVYMEEERQGELQKAQELQDMILGDPFDPQADPLAAAQGGMSSKPLPPILPSKGFSVPSMLQSIAQGSTICDLQSGSITASSGNDTDEDGLTDDQECILGTDPEAIDSDADTIPDGDEVRGFDYDGKHWYGDPLSLDSNGDGLPDALEWWVAFEGDVPGDTDGDGVPDLFDDDNDGDGVRDELDLSPFQASDSTFTRLDPLSLVIDGLQEGMPTFVEFQLRPSHPDQLWYAFNVFDWPYDDQAQMQDVDGATFASATGAGDLAGDNGDLRLVPMLEIRITGDNDNLPPSEQRQVNVKGEQILDPEGNPVTRTVYPDLEPYGIFVTPSNKGLTAYAPLQLVIDPLSGERLAFAGKMLYSPDVDWGNAQTVRLVWLLQALVDNVCVEVDDAGRCTSRINNQEQVIHSYYEDWSLTGLGVREARGSDLAILYEDPADDTDVEDDAGLIGLASVLDRTFLAGVDKDNDGQRDYVLIPPSGSSSKSLEELLTDWDLPDYLRIQSHSYDTPDQAMVSTISETSAQILDTAFSGYETANPTLLFAREDRSRRINLDQRCDEQMDVECDVSPVNWIGQKLTLSMAERNEEIDASLAWAPYQYRNGAWQAMPFEAYTAQLAARYQDADGPAEASPESIVDLMAVHAYYLTLYSGISNHVQSGARIIPSNEPSLTDQQFADELLSHLYGTGSSLQTTAEFTLSIVSPGVSGNKLAAHLFTISATRTAILREAGDITASLQATKFSAIAKISFGLTALGVASNIAAGTVPGEIAPRVLNILTGSIDTILVTLDVVEYSLSIANSLRTAAKEGLSKVGALGEALSGKAAGLKGSAIGLIISGVIIWGFFTGQVIDQGLEAGSPQYNFAVAYAVAATVVAVLCFLIGLDPVGAVLLTIVALVDSIAAIICAAGGDCFSILGSFTELLTGLFYDYAGGVTVEISSISQGGSSKDLVEPELGFQAGNILILRSTISTEIKNTKPSDDFRESVAFHYYDDYWNANKLDWTAISYAFNILPPDPVGYGWSTELDQVLEYPSYPPESPPSTLKLYRGSRDDQAIGNAPLQAGINSRPAIQMNIRYVMPGVECERILFVTDCDNTQFPGSSSDTIDVVLDVFPASLDGFYLLGARDAGLRWDSRFSLQRDYDGDGLISRAYGGIDPNDFKWDSDGDGLSDLYEFRLREQGVPVFAGDDNSDGDDLLDGEEIRLGTNPYRSDSDGDGLLDHEEVLGWEFRLGPDLVTWVTSDPLLADTDGDGMSDAAERDLHRSDPIRFPYSPRVFNPQPVALYTNFEGDVVWLKGQAFAEPGDDVVYSTRLINNLDEAFFASGSLTTTVDPENAAQSTPQEYALDAFGGAEQAFSTGLTIPTSGESQQVTLTNDVLVQLPPGQPGSVYLKRLNEYQWTAVDDNARSDLALLSEAEYASNVVAIADGEFGLNLLTEVAFTESGTRPVEETIALDSYAVQMVWEDTRAVAVGDIDGDGDPDVITGNANQPHRLYRNHGDGRDWTGSLLPGEARDTRAVALGDLDGDGDLDLVVGNYGQPNQIYWNLVEGRTWAISQVGDEADDTTSLALGDVDGDGDLDVVAGNYGQRNRLYLNNGDGSSWTVSDIGEEEENTTSIALGKIDCNDSIDLVVGNDGQINRLYQNDGNGSLSGAYEIPGDGVIEHTLAIALGDINGDGRPEVVVGNAGESIRVYRNPFIGDGCSELPGYWYDLATPGDSSDINALAIRDLDRDGDLDIVAGSRIDQQVIKYFNAGAGTGWSSKLVTSIAPLNSLGIADIDADGDPDLVIGNGPGRANFVFLNGGIGYSFDPSDGSAISADAQRTFSVDVGDIDRDGDLDIIAGNLQAANRVYWNDGRGQFTGSAWWGSSNTRAVVWASNVYFGQGGIVEGNAGQPNRVYIPTKYESGWQIGPGYNITDDAHNTVAIAAGDVDGDYFHSADVVAGNYNQPNFVYYSWPTYQGYPTWSRQEISTEANATQALALGDVDGDGDLDLVEGNNGINRVYINNGRSSPWTGLNLTGDSYDTRSIALGDVDGDGDLDVVAGNYGYFYDENGVRQDAPDRLYLNAGQGKRWIGSNITRSGDTGKTTTISLADIDSDGDLDVVVGEVGLNADGSTWLYPSGIYYNGESDDYAWFRFWDNGDYVHSLTWVRNQKIIDKPQDIALGDMDRDGDLDWVVGIDGHPNLLFKDLNIDTMISLDRFPSSRIASIYQGDNSAAVDLACNLAGRCLVAWQRFENNGTFRVIAALVHPDGTFGTSFPLEETYFVVNESFETVAVVTDGTNFLVAWSAEDQLYTRVVNENGEPGSAWVMAALNPNEQYLGRLLSQDRNVYEAKFDLTYAGEEGGVSQYVLIWRDHVGSRPIVKSMVLTPDGPMPEKVIFMGEPGEKLNFTQISYDPSGQQGGMLSYRLQPTDETTEFKIQSLPLDEHTSCEAALGASSEYPHVRGTLDLAFDPASGTWMLIYLIQTGGGDEYSTFVQAYDSDCTPVGLPENYVLDYVHFLDLACGAGECAFTSLAKADVWQLFLNRFQLETNPTPQGELTQQKVDHIWIDDDIPAVEVSEATIILPALAEASVFTLSGTASDPTSGISRVQVKQGDGNWVTVSGLEAWAHNVEITANFGTYNLSIRSEDLLGHWSEEILVVIQVVSPPELNSPIQQGQVWNLREDSEGRRVLAGIHGGAVGRGAGISSVEVRVSPHGIGWLPTDIEGGNWSIDYPLLDFDENAQYIDDLSGEYTIQVRATDGLGGMTSAANYLARLVIVDVAEPVSDLTTIDGNDPSEVLTLSQAGALSGTFSDASAVRVSFTNIQSDPLDFNWLPAEIDSPSGTWTFNVDAAQIPEGFYQIDVSAADGAGELLQDEGTWGQWRGMVDLHAPVVEVTVRSEGVGSTARAHYQLTATDLNLDEGSIDFPPCDGIGVVERETYVDDWYLEHSGDPARLFRLVHTCTLPGFPDEAAEPDRVLVSDTLGHVAEGSVPHHPSPVENTQATLNLGPDVSMDEGSAFSASGSFADPGGAETWTGSVDYGDGWGPQALELHPNSTFDLSHVYEENGIYTVTVELANGSGEVIQDKLTVTVQNVAPSVEAGEDAAVEIGTSFVGSGSFSDPGKLDTWTATVDYGDGSGEQTLELNPDQTFSLSHLYTGVGTYTVTITVTDDDGGSGDDTVLVTVVSASPSVDAGSDAIVDEGSTFTSLGSFFDPGGTETWTGTVDYGDGSEVQPLDLNPDATFELNHLYKDDGTYAVTVILTRESESISDDLTVTVQNVAPSVEVGLDVAIEPGDTFSGSGSFSDPGTLDSWTATVDYGDGSDLVALDLNPDQTFELRHLYPDVGEFTVTVTIIDDDGGQGVDSLTVTVQSGSSSMEMGNGQVVFQGGSGSLFLSSFHRFPAPSISNKGISFVSLGLVANNDPVVLDVAIFHPQNGSALIVTEPVAVRGGAYAIEMLRSLTLTANGMEVGVVEWVEEDAIPDTPWTLSWMPEAPGTYELQAEVLDWAGNRLQTGPVKVTLALEDQAPNISIDARPFNYQDLGNTNVIPLAGQATSPVGVSSVMVSIDGGSPQPALLTSVDHERATWQFSWPLADEAGVLEKDYLVTAIVKDALGRQAEASETIPVDVVLPQPVAVSLFANDESQPVEAGQNLRDAQALLIRWEGSDDTDLYGYHVGWTHDVEPAIAALAFYTDASQIHAQPVAEAQVYYAHVGVEDGAGNIAWITKGPVYVDGANTPDYITDLNYYGWMESGCSLIGVDRQVNRSAPPMAAFNAVQRLYASWDQGALHLTWTGANWDWDGDLFIYLDTSAGGAGDAFNPYGSGQPSIGMPSGLLADYVVWVEDGSRARLLRWTGSDWTSAMELGESLFQLNTNRSQPHTDILLPLDLLGEPTTLGLVAFASEEDALRLWAAMPDENPHSSSLVISDLAAGLEVAGFELTQDYFWHDLGSGQCPNAGQFTDSDLQMRLSTDPGAIVVNYLEDDWLALGPGTSPDADHDGILEVALPVDQVPGWLGEGDTISYTIRYANHGSQTATDVQVHLRALGALMIPGSETIFLGDISPEGTGSVHFTAQIVENGAGSAELQAVITDATHGEFNWLWALHLVDRDPPSSLVIRAPREYERSGQVIVNGTAQDASGLSEVKVAVDGMSACTDSSPQDGTWSCIWDVPAVADGVRYDLSAVATDTFGNQSDATTVSVIVDNTPPEVVELNPATLEALADGVLIPGEFVLRGTVEDNLQATAVRLCFTLDAVYSCTDVDAGTEGGWVYTITPFEADGEIEMLEIYGRDAAGNLSTAPLITLEYQIDNMGPKVEVLSRKSIVSLGADPVPILTGTARDGSGVGELLASLQSPSGMQWIHADRTADAWRVTPPVDQLGVHTLRLYARDGVGNLRGAGPYQFIVVEGEFTLVVEAGPDQVTEPGLLVSLPPATFYDSDPDRRHEAEVDWGDGTTQAVTPAESNGAGTISGSHNYAQAGDYEVEVCVRVIGEQIQACDSFHVTVQSKGITVEVDVTQPASEGSPVTLTVSFKAQGTIAPYRVSIDWGDGSPVEEVIINQNHGSGTVTVEHTYADDGDYELSVTLRSEDGAQSSTGFTITVDNVAPSVTLVGPTSVDEGQRVRYSYTSSDPSADTFTLNMESCGSGELSNSSFDGSTGGGSFDCTFANESAPVEVSVAIADDDGGSGTSSLVVTVNDLSPTAAFSWTPVSPIEGLPVQFTDESISDPDEIIEWAWDFAGLGAGAEQSPSFTFSDEGQFEVCLLVMDEDGSSDAICHMVTVINVAPVVEAGEDRMISEGEGITLDATTFRDSGNLDAHTATIDWGDGSPEEVGYVHEPQPGEDGRVEGSHVYGDNGTFTVTISVCDEVACGEDTFEVSANNLLPVLELDTTGMVSFAGGDAFFGRKGVLQTHEAWAIDPGSDDLIFDWSFGVSHTYFNDGVGPDPFPSTSGVFPFQAIDTAEVTCDAPGIHTMAVDVRDDDGGMDSESFLKVATGDEEWIRSRVYWLKQYSGKGKPQIDEATLQAYLDIVNFASRIFSEKVPASTIEEAQQVLKFSHRGIPGLVEAYLLVGWLNFASGAIDWDQPIYTHWKCGESTTYHELLYQVESLWLMRSATGFDIVLVKGFLLLKNLESAKMPGFCK